MKARQNTRGAERNPVIDIHREYTLVGGHLKILETMAVRTSCRHPQGRGRPGFGNDLFSA